MDSHLNICALIKRLNINDDSIVMNRKIKDLCMAQEFQNVANEDHMLKEAFISFNNCALNDPNFGINLALIFSSRSFDSFVENGSAVRAEMLNTLQKNYMNAENLRTDNIKQFYNSITLLGEYYNRCRINNGPVGVLGVALFELLLKHLDSNTNKSLTDSSHRIDEEFAKLILTQVTLNGLLAQPTHKTEIDSLLFAIRKCLIEVSQLSSNVKAFFLMTLDLYYSSFSNIGKELETMYAKFLTVSNDPVTASNQQQLPAELPSSSTGGVNNFSKLRNELSGLSGSGRNKQEIRINNEYIGRPLKASERLKFAQKQAASQKHKSETEEILQEKLFEKEMQVRNIENLKIIEQQTSASDCRDVNSDNKSDVSAQSSSPVKQSDDNQSIVSTKSKSSKERKEDQAYFLAKPLNVRQRLKAPEPQPPILIDWYDEVENSANNQINSNTLNSSSESTKKSHNGYHSNSSNPTSPNEIRRGNYMNNSFRSIRSDYSTRSMDRVGNPRYDYKGYDKRNNYNRGQYNQNNGGGGNYNNYNNNFQNNRNNFQRHGQGQSGPRLDQSGQGHSHGHGQGQGQGHIQQHQSQNHGYRRQNSDKGQNYSNKKNDNRGGGGGGAGYSNNYQPNRSYPSKSYGNRNRRQSYQHDRSETPKPFESGENWDN